MTLSSIARIPRTGLVQSVSNNCFALILQQMFDVVTVFVISVKDNSNLLHKYGPKLYPHFNPRDLRST